MFCKIMHTNPNKKYNITHQTRNNYICVFLYNIQTDESPTDPVKNTVVANLHPFV